MRQVMVRRLAATSFVTLLAAALAPIATAASADSTPLPDAATLLAIARALPPSTGSTTSNTGPGLFPYRAMVRSVDFLKASRTFAKK